MKYNLTITTEQEARTLATFEDKAQALAAFKKELDEMRALVLEEIVEKYDGAKWYAANILGRA